MWQCSSSRLPVTKINMGRSSLLVKTFVINDDKCLCRPSSAVDAVVERLGVLRCGSSRAHHDGARRLRC
jgi:hypothetical protein